MIVEPCRNVFQRALNRAGHRFGVKPFPVRFSSPLRGPRVFDDIYAKNYWQDDESRSGGGSTVEATAGYRPQLVHWLKALSIRSMFDAPCGDLNWMPLVLEQVEVDYIGGDIAAEAVAAALQRRRDLDIRQFDIRSDVFPAVDLWHCRDTFFHLSFEDIWKALDNAATSPIRYAALTTHKARLLKNLDVETGGFRLLDLERPPFNLPPALAYLRDYQPGGFPRYVGIWSIEALQQCVNHDH